MEQVQDGNTVTVHYTGKLEDGTVFDSSREREPMQVTLGSKQVIPGFEQGIMGMKAGGIKSITIAPDQAYGQRRDELMITVPKAQFGEGQEPEAGMTVQLQSKDGQKLNATICEVGETEVTLDGNHPLAGKTLNFELDLVSIG